MKFCFDEKIYSIKQSTDIYMFSIVTIGIFTLYFFLYTVTAMNY